MNINSLYITILIATVMFTLTPNIHAEIYKIKDLIQDAPEASWSDGSGNPITFNTQNSAASGVFRGKKVGGVNGFYDPKTHSRYYDDSVMAETIDIKFSPTLGRNDSLVRGSFVLELPSLKRVQLELLYDLFVDSNGKKSPGEFYVEVFEKDLLSPTDWIQTGDIHQKTYPEFLYVDKINQVGDEQFTTRSFVANLSEWAGKKVRVDLVAKVPNQVITNQKGRFVKAKLIGASFDYVIGKPEKSTSTKQSLNSILTPHTVPIDGISNHVQINLENVINYPDTGITTINIDGRWFGYMHGVRNTPFGHKGTYAFDLLNYSSQNFYSILSSNIPNTLLRGSTLTNAYPSPSGSIDPWRVLKASDILSDWYNSYVGITSALVADFYGTIRIHAFFHAEDWSQNNQTYNPNNWYYARVGYARSLDTYKAYNLVMKGYGTQTAQPIIVCYQPESAIDYTTSPRRSYGAGAPSVLKVGSDSFIMFYTRWLDGNPIGGWQWPQGSQPWDVGFHICAAKASINQVINEQISLPGRQNPWYKFYNNQFDINQNGNGGLSTAVITDYSPGSGQYRAFPKASFNSYLNTYLILCQGEDGFYLYDKSNIYTNPQFSTGIKLADLPTGMVVYPTMIGQGGDDKVTTQRNKIYYGLDNDTNPGGHVMWRSELEFK